jgi:ADP-dependent NAD(P)H-hydrate dehydratase / NAD(P)H-hydrate epimerase
MKLAVTASLMTELDKLSIQKYHIPGLILMENAGKGIAQVVIDFLGTATGKRVCIFCGPGNNGGDGYVIARHLKNSGCLIDVYVTAVREKIKGDALTQLTILENNATEIHFIQDIPVLEKPDLLIDALLGSGASGPLTGLYAKIVDYANSLSIPILSVDIPTGVNADTGDVSNPTIKANITATLAVPKIGLLLPPGRMHTGKLVVIDISMPEEVMTFKPPHTWWLEAQDIPSMLPQRASDAYKNQCGAVAVVAGSIGFTGAAALTSEAVLRAGAGLCYLCSPQSLNSIYEIKLTEVITWPFDDAGTGYLHNGCLPELIPKLHEQNAIAIGPGLGHHIKTVELVHKLLTSLNKPVVLDADGLNACAGSTDLLKNYPGPLVITPHPGELSRLTGLSTKEILANRTEISKRFAGEWGLTLVLKGAPSIIALKNGDIFINSTGNAGMATAGSGDVLTGLIAGLIAQGASVENATIAGVYLHGLAGDYASQQLGQMSMLAGDILQNIPQALTFMTGKPNAQ